VHARPRTRSAAGSLQQPLVLGIHDAGPLSLIPTYNVPAGTGHPAGTSHSIAANAANNLVFVPLPANNAELAPMRPKIA
jgi:hypothetical protein